MSDQDRISPYNIKQTSDENEVKYQLGDYKLIQYQILQINITRVVRQTVRRITDEILGVKGLIGSCACKNWGGEGGALRHNPTRESARKPNRRR